MPAAGPVPVPALGPLLRTTVAAGALPVSRRRSPEVRRRLADARRVSPASTSQSPSKTRLPCTPRRSRASLPCASASAQAMGRPCSWPRVRSWRPPDAVRAKRTGSPAQGDIARRGRGHARLPAGGFHLQRGRGACRHGERLRELHRPGARALSVAGLQAQFVDLRAPLVRAGGAAGAAQAQVQPALVEPRLAVQGKRGARHGAGHVGPHGREPERRGARAGAGPRRQGHFPARGGEAGLQLEGPAAVAPPVRGFATSPAVCNWPSRDSQPPFQRASRRASPCSAAPPRAVPRPGTDSIQRCTRCASATRRSSVPAPARGAMRPSTCAVAPGSVACNWPWAERSAVSMRNWRALACTCSASSCSCARVSRVPCQVPSVASRSMRSGGAACAVDVPPSRGARPVPAERMSAEKRTSGTGAASLWSAAGAPSLRAPGRTAARRPGC